MAGEDLAIQPKTEASRAAVEAVHEGDWWLLIFLTVFSFPFPNWLFCSSSLFASSRSRITLLNVLYSSNILLATLILTTFFFLSLTIISHLLSAFVFCGANLAYFFLLCKRKWKEHSILPLHRSFLCIAVLFFSHILCWVSEDCKLFGAETLCYCMVVQCLA